MMVDPYDIGAVSDPVWGDAAHTYITCKVVFPNNPNLSGPIPYNAMASDPMAHGARLFQDLVAGKYGPIKEAQ